MKRKPARRRGFQTGGQIPGSAVAPLNTPSSMDTATSAMNMYKTYQDIKMGQSRPNAPPSPDTPKSSPPDASQPANLQKQRGGKIARTAGPRIGKDDGLIPAQRGEYVVRKSAVKKLGTKALDTINRGKLPHSRGR